jgi:hypothetical protein
MMDRFGYWIASRASDVHVHVRAVVKEDDGLVTGEVVSVLKVARPSLQSQFVVQGKIDFSLLTFDKREMASYFGFSSDSSLALAHMYMYTPVVAHHTTVKCNCYMHE